MEYVNKSGVAALRGIGYTGQLDDDGLPDLRWYGVRVDEFTYGKLIRSVLAEVKYETLPKVEQTAIVELICQNVGGRPFQRKEVRRIVRGYVNGT